MSEITAQRIVLNAPIQGVPKLSDFRFETFQLSELLDGQFLIRNVYCSVDPGTRSRLSAGVSYTANLKAGEMISSFAMGWVSASKHPKYSKGTWVVHASGWADLQISDGRGYLQKIDPRWVESGLSLDARGTTTSSNLAKRGVALSTWIGVLGIPGMTAWFGMKRVGEVSEGSRVLITSAACPENFDVLFDNVGNSMIDLAIPLLRPRARIVVSGQVADYNRSAADMPGLFNTRHFIAKRLRMEGILVFDDLKQFSIAQEQIATWIEQDQFAWKEELFEGIHAMPTAFVGLFTGQSFGRRIVQVGSIGAET